MTLSVGDFELRAEHVSKVVTGFALRNYIFKNLCAVESSNSWKETYYQETATDLSGGTGSAVEGVPRLAQFPYGEVSWKQQTTRNKKHAFEGSISYEDIKTNDIDVWARTMLRVARAVTKSVDAEIWDVITESRSAVNINSVSITAGYEWDSSTVAQRDPIKDILAAIQAIQEQDYDPLNGRGALLLSPKDHANLLNNSNVVNSGQFWTSSPTKSGTISRICGLDILVSNNVTADYAAVVVKKDACTWKQAAPLTVETIDDPGIKKVIRAYEIGCAQLKNPKAVCLISNTQE